MSGIFIKVIENLENVRDLIFDVSSLTHTQFEFIKQYTPDITRKYKWFSQNGFRVNYHDLALYDSVKNSKQERAEILKLFDELVVVVKQRIDYKIQVRYKSLDDAISTFGKYRNHDKHLSCGGGIVCFDFGRLFNNDFASKLDKLDETLPLYDLIGGWCIEQPSKYTFEQLPQLSDLTVSLTYHERTWLHRWLSQVCRDTENDYAKSIHKSIVGKLIH